MTDTSEHSPQSPLATVTNIAHVRDNRVMQKRLQALAENLGDTVDIYLNRALTDRQKNEWAGKLPKIKSLFLQSFQPLFKADDGLFTREKLQQRFKASKAQFAALVKEFGSSPMMQEMNLLFQNICGQMEAKIAFGGDAQRASAPAKGS